MPKSALPNKSSRQEWLESRLKPRKDFSRSTGRRTGFGNYSKYEDTGGRYGYHSNAQKKQWNGGVSVHTDTSNRSSDTSFRDENIYQKQISKLKPIYKRERRQSSQKSAMANGRRVK